ncbi:molybdate ABC transporter permease subunit [Paenibacillus hunanensis]|uniref:Molybdenum transport system permease n=1 Tax=Paenibacillus hunanensis TaxID=539262 RepID=A0ABU1IVT2_9BACL|nr:molybdate ABC transporter permease subunit [Paenibacillus hunanensis]MCL9662571.1 molybdate ABC transporter permease subunit [Paenibacillus hunanensis]MDR6243031.1 molybdate transport system permease protein [Paenibacillus hunanensis]GGJ12494.1 putative molybdenum transport system permease protein YvgM [Paenibacillus hunanensis]
MSMVWSWEAVGFPVTLSLQIACLSSVIVFILATLAALWMNRVHFPGQIIVETLFMLPLVLPPSVVGLILLTILGRRSWIGQAAEWLTHQPIVFSVTGAVIAAVVVAFPLVYQALKTGFALVNREVLESARSQGANELQVLWFMVLPLAWRSLVTGFVLGFARALGEFGATLMVAGNIPGKTQTLPTAIYFAVDAGNMQLAWSMTIITILISFILLLATSKIRGSD